jgi:transcriptional regulator with XRE-family HTH domain
LTEKDDITVDVDEPSPTEPPEIGIRVRAARERLGWSREALAYHSKLSWSAIAQVESGRRRNLRPQTLSALAESLGLSVDYLIGGARADLTMLEHRALVYNADHEVVEVLAPFLREGIERSEALLAVTTAANVELLREHLGPDAERVKFVEAQDWYQEPGSVLRAYKAFVSEKAQAGAPWVRIVGELPWSGWSESEICIWTRYESLFNLIFAASPVSAICPYDTRSVSPDVAQQARCTHPQTIGPEGITNSSDYADPTGFAFGQ